MIIAPSRRAVAATTHIAGEWRAAPAGQGPPCGAGPGRRRRWRARPGGCGPRIEEGEGRPRIAVARLTTLPGLTISRSSSTTMRCPGVGTSVAKASLPVAPLRQRRPAHVRVPHEADVAGEIAEIGNRDARVGDVLPHRVLGLPWATATSPNIPAGSSREKLPVDRREHAAGPLAGRTGVGVEPNQVGLADGAPIVIPDQRRQGQLLQALDDLVRRRPIAHQVAQAPDLVDAPGGTEHGVKRRDVAVHVGDDQDRQVRAPSFDAPKAALAPLCVGIPRVRGARRWPILAMLPSRAAARVEVEPCDAIQGKS